MSAREGDLLLAIYDALSEVWPDDSDERTRDLKSGLTTALLRHLPAAVEQRTLAEQKVADLERQVDALTTELANIHAKTVSGALTGQVCTDPDCTIPRRPGRPMHGPHTFRAALADPEADRGGTT